MAPPARPLSITHLLAPTRFGGLETVVVTLAPTLAALGAEVSVVLVVTPDDDEAGGHPVARALHGSGVEVETLVIPAKAYLEERRRVAELLGRYGTDVLHTHGYRPDIADASVARRRGVATASTVHGRTGGSMKGRFYEWVQTRALRRFGAVIAVSAKLHRELRAAGVPGERLHLIPNAWAPSSEPLPRDQARARLGLPLEAPVVGWIGRMGKEKAPDVMIRAAAQVQTPGARFSMVGDGPERAAGEEIATEAGLEDRVHWHGAVENAGRLIRAFDAIALTSWTEGTPMVLLEAMSAQVPVVTTAVGGVPAVVGDAQAHLCEAGDTREIAASIDDILRAPEEAVKRARSAKERLDREFAVEPWARRHLDIYGGLVRNR